MSQVLTNPYNKNVWSLAERWKKKALTKAVNTIFCMFLVLYFYYPQFIVQYVYDKVTKYIDIDKIDQMEYNKYLKVDQLLYNNVEIEEVVEEMSKEIIKESIELKKND